MKQAIIFDLDDTLYRERRFMLSGFAAVAGLIEQRSGVPRRDVFAQLRQTASHGARQRAFQLLCERFDLPSLLVDELRTLVRSHQPRLRLPRMTQEVLRSLRPTYRVGILTNGLAATQANKVAALGLSSLVDTVVYAEDTGVSKPSPTPFHVVLEQLNVSALDAVFVGDDPQCDIFGARRVGMSTIRVWRRGHGELSAAHEADTVVTSLVEVPVAASWLLSPRRAMEERRHVA